ncbi:hypothetical protein Pmani_032549 [Petrolisthes manimaculis]|uniref:Transmembrane protein n=1 Tax=Petrolisthes manimaculis TaxID=1843537 RepID=A0AAE1NRK8_9EUCA|nr:hypothetical protein Pmani_032549 [Petrolisthes manimaculis]
MVSDEGIGVVRVMRVRGGDDSVVRVMWMGGSVVRVMWVGFSVVRVMWVGGSEAVVGSVVVVVVRLMRM